MTRTQASPARRSSRRRSREFVLQGLYQWLLAGTDAATIEQQMSAVQGFDKADRAFFSALLAGVIREAAASRAGAAAVSGSQVRGTEPDRTRDPADRGL